MFIVHVIMLSLRVIFARSTTLEQCSFSRRTCHTVSKSYDVSYVQTCTVVRWV